MDFLLQIAQAVCITVGLAATIYFAVMMNRLKDANAEIANVFMVLAVAGGALAIFSFGEVAVEKKLWLLNVVVAALAFFARVFESDITLAATPEPVQAPTPAPVADDNEVKPLTQEEEDARLARMKLNDDRRTEHAMVVARSGSGKTELFKHLLLNDMEEDCTIIVIDSQPSLITDLLHVVPHDRVMHLTPIDRRFPLALNLFDKNQDSALIEYIFESQEQKLTPNQATVYRMVARLVAEVNGNLDTMREILEPGGSAKYEIFFNRFPPHVQSFFRTQFDKDRMYLEARSAILRRINALLEVPMFAEMFSAPRSKVNIAQGIDDKKIILIETAKSTLTGEAFQIFGRFFIAQIARAIFTRREPFPHRVYLYIDEAQEYFADEGMMVELFTQARKYNVGIIVAFQFLAQLPDKVGRAILSNTAIKIVGTLSAADARAMAAEMQRSVEMVQGLPKGMFVIDQGAEFDRLWRIELGRMSRMPKRSRDELDALRHRMREAYSYQPSEMEIPTDKPSHSVDETSKW